MWLHRYVRGECRGVVLPGAPCPNGGFNVIDGVEEPECPEGESCFGDIPCDSNAAPTPIPVRPPPPTVAPTQFCGGTLAEAQSQCWQPCPRGSSDCCLGLDCFDTTQNGGTCSSSDYSGTNHFYCGTSWCNAAFSCGTPCPGGDVECPDGEFCYADVPCNSNEPPFVPPQPASPLSKYCGTSAADAAENSYWSGDLASVESDAGQRYNYKCINEPFCVSSIEPSESKYWVRTGACGAALMRFSVLVGLSTFAVFCLLL
ncbi:hypothetical protein QTG54_008590 [Skeletonema marinoi]|uniref:Uncharacterized protein n=1 Tax=Skeletonema marinoi TaxID=267567 RepID=A0AAD8Y8I5_9STRA|nr:hypothetical protein QTG54_008590 [Skeletonema marinoi]